MTQYRIIKNWKVLSVVNSEDEAKAYTKAHLGSKYRKADSEVCPDHVQYDKDNCPIHRTGQAK